MRIPICLCVALLGALSSTAFADQAASCLEKADSQRQMNECSEIDLAQADAEVNRVIEAVRAAYKDQPEFLEKLDASQLAWIALRDANLELKYPLDDKQHNYGSVYPMCASGYLTQLTLQRIEFLKQWLIGHGDGEVCGGSVMHSYCLQHDCSAIRKNKN